MEEYCEFAYHISKHFTIILTNIEIQSAPVAPTNCAKQIRKNTVSIV